MVLVNNRFLSSILTLLGATAIMVNTAQERECKLSNYENLYELINTRVSVLVNDSIDDGIIYSAIKRIVSSAVEERINAMVDASIAGTVTTSLSNFLNSQPG